MNVSAPRAAGSDVLLVDRYRSEGSIAPRVAPRAGLYRYVWAHSAIGAARPGFDRGVRCLMAGGGQ